MIRIFSQRAQSVTEYVVLISVIVAALVAMQIFTKRAASGRLKGAFDQIGPQYDAKKTESTFHTIVTSNITEWSDGSETRVDFGYENNPGQITERWGTETIEGWNE